MVKDMVTGGVWTPDTDTVRDFYNLGRWADDTQGDARGASTTQGERESEFDRWLQEERSKVWTQCVEHLEVPLGQATKRAAHADNPYLAEDFDASHH